MNRKAALIGCRKGEWVRTAGLRALHLEAKVSETTMLVISHRVSDDEVVDAVFVGPGRHPLKAADWIMVSIIDGPHEGALCILEGAA